VEATGKGFVISVGLKGDLGKVVENAAGSLGAG
jgi:hypothetical protein